MCLDSIIFMVSADEMKELRDRYFARYGKKITTLSAGSGYVLVDPPKGSEMEMLTWQREMKEEAQKLRDAIKRERMMA